MFEKEMDELYGLCKRVVHEVTNAFVAFEYAPDGLSVYGTKNKNGIYVEDETFSWDIYARIYNDPELEKYSRAAYESAKAYLLELLIDGKCPHE